VLFVAPLAPENLPGGSFAASFRDEFSRDPGPYAAYGYEAMRVALAAIESADGADEFRPAVVDGVLGSDYPDSVVGEFSITDDGDSTLCRIQPYALAPRLSALPPVCPTG
jgi:branched-chain amino acid transport system substrate-binding protein